MSAVAAAFGAVAQAQMDTGGKRAERREAIGPIYEIVEPDMLEAIEQRLKKLEKSGELSRRIDEAKTRSVRSAENPRPVPGLGKADTNRTYYFNPSVQVSQDIRDPQGRLIVKAGTLVNPLDYASMNTWLLFFDGSDRRQVALAERIGRKYEWNIKPILVAGGPLALSREWKRQVYFDQGGFLVRRMGIQNVPALVTQEGKEMRIDELRF